MAYGFNETCATDGLCAIACPVNIDTGALVKELRWKENGRWANSIASSIANNMKEVTSIIRGVMKTPHAIAKTIGYHNMESITKGLYKVGNGLLPLWTRYTPSSSKKIVRDISRPRSADSPHGSLFPIVYHPLHGRCILWIQGNGRRSRQNALVVAKSKLHGHHSRGRKTSSAAEWLLAAKVFASKHDKKRRN